MPRPNPAPTPLFVDVARAPLATPAQTAPLTTTPITAISTTQPLTAPLPAATPPTLTEQLAPISARVSPRPSRDWNKILTRSGTVLLILLLVGAGTILFNNLQQRPTQLQTSNAINSTTIPLSEFEDSGSLNLLGGQSLIVNGQLRANESFVLAPQTTPATGERGQIYYDTNSDQLAYYNGTQFINLPGANFVQSFQGQSGNVSLTAGNGIAIVGTTVTNNGVTSVGGVAGDITLGPGLSLTGATLQATGVQSLTSGSVSLTVTDDGAGNLTITSAGGGGAGTVTSGGGTNGAIPMFTGAQNIEDSVITQSGGNITVGGDLAITGAFTLSSPLSVANGGTGAGALTANGVIIGNGGSPLSSVTAGGAGLCLVSTGGAPAFAACPGAGGVTSLDGLSGALTIANSSGIGTTITIDNASTAQKGIAQFDATNFSHSGGLINTIQNINTAASPTFTGLTLSGDLTVNGGDITSSGALNITSGGTLIVGATTQTLTLQGGALSTFSATSGANTTTLSFQAPGANVNYRFPTAALGTYDICSTAGNCTGIGGGVTTAGGSINRLAKFTAAQGIGDSTISDNGTSVNTTVDLVIQGGDVTVGVASSQIGTVNFAHSGSAFLGSITQGALTGNQTYTLPNASGDFCLTSGNCTGSGSTSTLQAAYAAGNSITTTTGRDIDIVLADTTVDSNFDIVVADNSTSTVSISRADGAGTADPSQLILIDNLDTDRLIAAGIKVQAAAGGITSAIDASDAELVNALSTGDNHIIGGASDLNFTNFDVTGANGNIVTAGDLALNGGDLTSTGIFNLTPGGAMTLGVTSQSASLRGTVTTITSNGATNDIVLNSADTIELQDATNITGNLTVTGSAIEALVVKASTNGSSAVVLNVQQSDSDSIMRLTDDGTLAVGNGTNIAGILALGKGSGSVFGDIRVTALTNSTTYNLPEIGGGSTTICTLAGNCGTSTGTLQAAYTYSAGTTTPEIKLDATRNGIEIQDADGLGIGSGQNFLSLRGPNAGGLGSVLFGVGTQGNLFMQPSTNRVDLVDINTNGGDNLLTVDSINSRVGIALGSTNAPNFTLDVGGTLNVSGAVTFGSTLAVTSAITATTLGAADTATHLCRNSSNQIASCTAGGTSFIQDGNSFGATGTLGTNDAQALGLETSDTTRLTIGATGGITVAAANTLTVTSALTSLTGASTGDALNVSNDASTGNIAVFKDGSTSVVTFADAGATTFQNSTDSTTAFRVLNLGSVPQIVVDTTNSRTYIGNPASDTTGALLVLDTKSGSGDPSTTGLTGGAMYYNANSNTFRCFENSVWYDCISRHKIVLGSDVADSSGACTNQDITGLNFAVVSGRAYRFYAIINYSAAAAGTGAQWTATAPTNNYFALKVRNPTSGSSDDLSNINTSDGGNCSASSAATTGNPLVMEGIVEPTASGNVQLRMATEVNGSAITVEAGSTLEWW